MISLVATGLMLFSGKGYPKACRFFHPAFVLVFYLVIIMHIVHESKKNKLTSNETHGKIITSSKIGVVSIKKEASF